jgi:hypothetical protein
MVQRKAMKLAVARLRNQGLVEARPVGGVLDEAFVLLCGAARKLYFGRNSRSWRTDDVIVITR